MAVGVLAGAVGSAVTGLLLVSAAWAALSLLIGRFPFRVTRSDGILLLSASLYSLIGVCLMLVNLETGTTDGGRLASKAVPLLMFLTVWLLLPRLRASSAGLLQAFISGASICGLLALPPAIWQSGYLGIRAEGFAGNALPFALICCLFGVISLLNITSADIWRRTLGWCGFIASLACLFLSGSRGLLPVPFAGLCVFALFFRSAIGRYWNLQGLILSIVVIAALSVSAIYNAGRLEALYGMAMGAAREESLSSRLLLWNHAWSLFCDRPFLGYGIQNRLSRIAETGLTYSHFHNGYLTVLVDSGIFGLVSLLLLLASPVIIALRAPSDNARRHRIFAAVALSSTYAFGGLTNFIFGHDIYDSVFLWGAIVIAASVPRSPENPFWPYRQEE